MASINDYIDILYGITKNFRGVGHAIKGTDIKNNINLIKNNIYLAKYNLDKTSRIIKLKKHKFNIKRRKVKKLS